MKKSDVRSSRRVLSDRVAMRPGLIVAVALVALLLGACSSVEQYLPDRRADYKRAKSVDTLEIPPDLTSSSIDDTLVVPELAPTGSATFSDYSKERVDGVNVQQNLLPQPDNIKIERDGLDRWLVVNADPQEVWPRVRRFFDDSGFSIDTENPATGVIETGWMEDRADVPEGFLRDFLGKYTNPVYSSKLRDRYRVRVEPGLVAGTTDVYLTHYGVVQVEVGNSASVDYVWQPRPRDADLEAIMMRRLMVFLGTDEDRAVQLLAERPQGSAPRAQIRTSDISEQYLRVDESIARSWRLIGIALDASNFIIEDRDPEGFVYTVRYRDPAAEQSGKSIFSSVAFWRTDPSEVPYEVRLRAVSQTITRVTVHDEDGDVSRSDTARTILESLVAELN